MRSRVLSEEITLGEYFPRPSAFRAAPSPGASLRQALQGLFGKHKADNRKKPPRKTQGDRSSSIRITLPPPVQDRASTAPPPREEGEDRKSDVTARPKPLPPPKPIEPAKPLEAKRDPTPVPAPPSSEEE